jgi:beta-lactamase regulating signal transducer with metallopeptidase domain
MPSLDVVLNAWGHGLLLTAAVAVALRFAPRANGATRHALWWATLALVIADMAVVWIMASRAPVSITAMVGQALPLQLNAVPAIAVPAVPATLEWLVIAAWALVAAVLLFRVGSGYRAIQLLKKSTLAFPKDRLARLRHTMQLRTESNRRSRVRSSSMLPGAAVLGGRHPVLVVGATFAEGLADDDLDRVLVHEQTHVDRRDDWAALAEACVAALCWCHPAVWFIVRRLDFEREVACDDRVVAVTGDARAYASALARVRLLMGGASAPGLAPAASRTSREFLGRVDRLMQAPATVRPSVTWWRYAAGCGALVFAFASLHAMPAMFVLSVDTDARVSAQPAPPTVLIAQAVAPADVQASAQPRPVPAPSRSLERVAHIDQAAFGISAPLLVAPHGDQPRQAIETPAPDVIDPAQPPLLTAPAVDHTLFASTGPGGSLVLPVPPAGVVQDHPSGLEAAGVAVARAGKKTAGFFTRVSVAIAKGVAGR